MSSRHGWPFDSVVDLAVDMLPEVIGNELSVEQHGVLLPVPCR